ncbi:unnamed protein product [Paramecium octaurelia]|uniref:Tryptophan synthase beta chain-like PALP domain-containing protein n=1 Tax=Paramecium octaurelia TaxID=43137 RepID=A0A8S1VZQ2_PAROT|nr:unnamed protein product [Paramecium octaurelia]
MGTSILAVTITYSYLRRRQIPKKRLADIIGNTPLIYLKSLSEQTGREIYAKCEFMNPGSSMKDRTALALIQYGIQQGHLGVKNNTIYEGTSGSTGVSLTLIGNSLGCKCKLYLQNDLAQEKYNILQTCGAIIEKVPPVSIVDSEHFCKKAEKQASIEGGYYADQFHNLANQQAHFQTGKEIYEQTYGLIDCFVMSSGTGGSIAGISQYLKGKNKNIKVILADPPGSSLKTHVNSGVCYTYQEAEGHRLKNPFDTVIEGCGLNRLTQNYLQAKIDYGFTIQDKESIQMAQFLIEKEGLFVGASSAMNCVAVLKAVEKYPECKVFVTILCDSGQRYLSKFYNKEYLQQHKIEY